MINVRCRAYSLLLGLCDMLVRFEERADVHRLASPLVPMDGPVEGKFQGPLVEVSISL